MWPRKMSAIRFISSRSLLATARTLTIISSRSICGASVSSSTFTTSMRRFRCLVICSSVSCEALETMVIRDSEASSVGATVSDSML